MKARPVIFSLLLILATLAAYWPLHEAAFTNFDDPLYVTNNPHVFHGFSARSLAWAFTTLHATNWHPLTWISHMLDCQWFGENAGAHHLVSVAIHILNSLLLFQFLRKTTGAFHRSAWVAALFALHPLHVESVAWISERKDVLSMFFFMLTLLAFANRNQKSEVRDQKSEDRGQKSEGRDQKSEVRPLSSDLRPLSSVLWLPAFFFALGLMSKPMLVTVPFVLVLLDYWPLRRVAFDARAAGLHKALIEKWPFFVLAAASCVITFVAQSKGGAVVRIEHSSLWARIMNAADAYVFYLAKCFWPTKLAAFYPYRREILIWPALAALGFLTLATMACVWQGRRRPYLLVGWLWFLGTLVPVIGLVQVGSQSMADRYTYIPSIGIFFLVAWGAAEVMSHFRLGRAVGLALAGGTAACCGMVTWVQTHYWHDSVSLFQRVLVVSPDRDALGHHNLGHAYALMGNQREAMRQYAECLRVAPDYAQGHYNLGNTLGVLGRLDEAMAEFYLALRYKPDYEQAYFNLGNSFAQLGKFPEAKTNFTAAIRCKPDYAEAYVRLGNTLDILGDREAAITNYLQALQIQPDLAEGHYYLATMWARQRRFPEARQHFYTALKSNPSYTSALNDLAWIQATEADPDLPEAIRLSTRACELTRYTNPAYLDTLGVALSRVGRVPEAIRITERALQCASLPSDDRVRAEIEMHLKSYQAKIPNP